MELTNFEQFFQLLTSTQSILIVVPEGGTTDLFASSLALQGFLGKLGKTTQVLASGQRAETIRFLPGSESIANTLNAQGAFSIVVDTSERKLSELSYETKSDKVFVVLKSNNGIFSPNDISFSNSYTNFDLIITLGAQNLESLGDAFAQNPELFHSVPIVNIDTHPDNEYFGVVNIVSVTVVALSELLFEMFEQRSDIQMDEPIATALLSGIIAATGSFQSVRTTPQVFSRAASLVARGAKQQEIIQHIFKTKPLPLLKLWGRSLARLKTLDSVQVAYSVLSALDFEKTGGSVEYVPDVLRELLDNIAGFRLLAVLAETPSGTDIFISFQEYINYRQISQELGVSPEAVRQMPSGARYVHMHVPGSVATVEQQFARILSTSLPNTLNNQTAA